MQLHHVEFTATGRFSPLFLDYINQKTALRPFYGEFPEVKKFNKVIRERQFDSEKRVLLVEALHRQYLGPEQSEQVSGNINALLSGSTFTVTTGHQLNLCTGPLYFIYKIVTAINMAKALKNQYPEYNFVPVYWMASEDHDFEEINHFRLFGKTIHWQSDQAGPVGRMNTQSLDTLLAEIPEIPEFIKTAYFQSGNLAQAMRRLAHHVFSDYGLVIVDGDDATLKNMFSSIMLDDLTNHNAHRLSSNATGALEQMGYKGQVFPREINLFYMEDGIRERIEKTDGRYAVLNTDLTFDASAMKKLALESPEKLSPNVILRPLYQETILPNLAYIGGPAEVAYWLQLKPVFDSYQIPFPMVVPRLFVMIIPTAIRKKINKLGLDDHDLFRTFTELKEKILRRDSTNFYDLSDEIAALKNLFESIKQKAGSVDKTLEGLVMGEYKNVEKSMDQLGKRIKKAEEQRHEIVLSQLQSVLDKLFPGGNLQEREDNFLNFYLNDPEFLKELVDKLNPFDFRFNILKEHA